MRSYGLILFAVLFFASTAFSSWLAPLEVAQGPKVEGEYIVLFSTALRENGFKEAISSMIERWEKLGDTSKLIETFVIGDTFKAAHVNLTYTGLLSVMTHPLVKLVSENAVVTTGQEPACREQKDVIWNLDRINTREIDLVDDNYHYSYDGEGVDSYVIDTGVLTTHVEFGGRAHWGENFSGDGQDRDCNGHGTHVAGTIAGELYGVVKKANIIAVKVLTCGGSGSNAGVIAGVQYTVNQAVSRKRPSVANMSLGGGLSTPVNEAVNAAVKEGVTMVVAAGNSRANACSFSPASATLALTVASTEIAAAGSGEQQEDKRSSFSNFGECVDIAAPGSLIKAAWIDKEGIAPNHVYNVISGTSMASPHVAGVAAVLLSAQPELKPEEVAARLVADANLGMIDFDCNGNEVCEKTPNVLLHTNTCA